MPEDTNKDDARLKEDSSAAARQRFERDLQEGEQWASLSGKTIDLTQLLRWSVSNATRGEDAPAAASESARKHEPIDPKWLDVILGKGDMQRMKECMEKILDVDLDGDNAKFAAFDELELLVEDIDNAKDFIKTNLWRLLLPFIQHPDRADYRMHALWILGTMVQNNPAIKKAYLENGVLARLLDALDSEKDDQVLGKLIYCLSGYLKHNQPGQEEFLAQSGIRHVFRILFDQDATASLSAEQEDIGSLHRKLVFMVASLLQDETVPGIVRHFVSVRPLVCADFESLLQRHPNVEDYSDKIRDIILPKLSSGV